MEQCCCVLRSETVGEQGSPLTRGNGIVKPCGRMRESRKEGGREKDSKGSGAEPRPEGRVGIRKPQRANSITSSINVLNPNHLLSAEKGALWW